MPNFIHEEFIEDISLCDRIIEAHKNNDNKWQGKVGNGINIATKDSIDSKLDGDLVQEYAAQLQKIVKNYVELFPSCNMHAPWGVIEAVNVQHYAPHGGFKKWHTERSTINPPSAYRHLVFMTYLNDVTDQGGTEFAEYKLTISAEKGKTVIWPVDWTHTHRGVVSPTQDKYIVTGWFSYLE
jgi:prolyl 4-hydroxylase